MTFHQKGRNSPNPHNQTFMQESIRFGKGPDHSHRVFVILYSTALSQQELSSNKNTERLKKEPFELSKDDEE